MMLCTALLCAVTVVGAQCQKETAIVSYSFIASGIPACTWQASNFTANYIYGQRREDRPKHLATTWMKITYRHIQRGN